MHSLMLWLSSYKLLFFLPMQPYPTQQQLHPPLHHNVPDNLQHSIGMGRVVLAFGVPSGGYERLGMLIRPMLSTMISALVRS